MSNWRQDDDILMIRGMYTRCRRQCQRSRMVNHSVEFVVLLLARHQVADAKQFLDGYNGPEHLLSESMAYQGQCLGYRAGQ
jgi:hypothetical protein